MKSDYQKNQETNGKGSAVAPIAFIIGAFFGLIISGIITFIVDVGMPEVDDLGPVFVISWAASAMLFFVLIINSAME